MGQSIDCQPHFGHQVGRRKASYANHAAQVGEKTAVCLLSDKLLVGDAAIKQVLKMPPLSLASHIAMPTQLWCDPLVH